jgi:hypothetical protein
MFTCCAIKLIPTIKSCIDQLPFELDLLVTDKNNFPLLLTFVYDRTGSPTKDTDIVLEPNSAQGVDSKCGKNVDKSKTPKSNDNNGIDYMISEKEKVSEASLNKKEIDPVSEEVSRL